MKCLAHSEDSVNVTKWGGGAVDGGGAGSRENYEESSLRLMWTATSARIVPFSKRS